VVEAERNPVWIAVFLVEGKREALKLYAARPHIAVEPVGLVADEDAAVAEDRNLDIVVLLGELLAEVLALVVLAYVLEDHVDVVESRVHYEAGK
jgi:hypothetical protein